MKLFVIKTVILLVALTAVSQSQEHSYSTALVTLPANAKLPASEGMQVSVDGQAAKVVSTANSEDLPLDLEIVIVGGSTPPRNLSLEKSLYAAIVKSNIRPKQDRVMLVYAGDRIAASDWSDDIPTVLGAIANQPMPVSSARLDQAVDYGISQFSKDDKRRREMILFANPFALSEASVQHQSELEGQFRKCSERAQKTGVIIFTVNIIPHQIVVISRAEVRETNNSGRAILVDLAKSTGGQYLDPDTSRLVQETDTILHASFTNQRLITFEWPAMKDNGKLAVTSKDLKIAAPQRVWRKK